MLLSVISPSICIDKLVQKTSENFVHFISHLDESFTVPQDWKSIIYTSKHISRLLALKKPPIPLKYFREAKPDKPFAVKLRNGQSIKVTMFTSSSYTGNLVFHFESESRTALYCGRVLNTRMLLSNQFLLSYMHMGIDFVYVDNVRAHSSNLATIDNAGSQIKEIHRKYPGHQIHLNIPEFGFEDLLVSLVKIHKLKVAVDSLLLKAFADFNVDNIFERDQKNSNVIVGAEIIGADKIERRFKKHKKITLRLIECDFEPKNMNFEKFGLFQVHFSVHPSLFDMYGFIQSLAPKYVFEIFDDFPKIPKFIKALCKNGNVYEQQKENDNKNNKQQRFNIDIGDVLLHEPINPAVNNGRVPSHKSTESDCVVISSGLISSPHNNLPRKRPYKGPRRNGEAVNQRTAAGPQDFEEFLAASKVSNISLSVDEDESDTEYLEVVELEDLQEKSIGKYEKMFKSKPKKIKKQKRETSKLSKLGDVKILGSPTASLLEITKVRKRREKFVRNLEETIKTAKRPPVPMCVIPEKAKILIRSKIKNRNKLIYAPSDID